MEASPLVEDLTTTTVGNNSIDATVEIKEIAENPISTIVKVDLAVENSANTTMELSPLTVNTFTADYQDTILAHKKEVVNLTQMFTNSPDSLKMMINIIWINQSKSGNLAAEPTSKPTARPTTSEKADLKTNIEKTVNPAPVVTL